MGNGNVVGMVCEHWNAEHYECSGGFEGHH